MMPHHIRLSPLPAALLLAVLAGLAAVLPAQAAAPVHHDLAVQLSPAEHRLAANDTITFPDGTPLEVEILLHAGLNPGTTTPGARLSPLPPQPEDEPLAPYRLTRPAGGGPVTLTYSGSIDHDPAAEGRQYGRSVASSPGTIRPQGVVLHGGSGWYPLLPEQPVSGRVRVELPAGWQAVGQDRRLERQADGERVITAWQVTSPQEELYLVAGPFVETSRPAGGITAFTFLRQDDPELAWRYLDATAEYLTLYQGLLGPYPYASFSLVENFWETGFGMPSFTLLGSKVIRFPFILTSSYPHEILHNWWGNGVFIDFARGNWAEGLTAYLADHLLKEQGGTDAAYREATLHKYTDYAASGHDLALTAFRSRHSAATEAVGYGKALMLFHMLRRQLGDEVFLAGLRDFFASRTFQVASWADLEESLSRAAGRDLAPFFRQWLERTGAPELTLGPTSVRPDGTGFLLRAKLLQTQTGEPYALFVPLAVTLEGEEEVLWQEAAMSGRQLDLELRVAKRPLRLEVDPLFDLFRRLAKAEIPPAFSEALGAAETLFLLPAAAAVQAGAACQELARAWTDGSTAAVTVAGEDTVAELPATGAVVVCGWDNRWRSAVADALQGKGAGLTAQGLTLPSGPVARAEQGVVLAARRGGPAGLPLIWLGVDDPAMAAAVGRKLPHYHKYSYLAFAGAEAKNTGKGRWPVADSPLARLLATGSEKAPPRGRLPQRQPLAQPAASVSGQRLLADVRFLAAPERQGRASGSAGAREAAAFIAGAFRQAGLTPAGDHDDFFQTWEEPATETGEPIRLTNVVAKLPGRGQDPTAAAIVLGAHYDGLGLGPPDAASGGQIHAGANDNASGVAVLLEVARMLGQGARPLARPLFLVAFDGEELGKKGSRHFLAASTALAADRCQAMVNLDTVGRLTQGPVLVLGAEGSPGWQPLLEAAGGRSGVGVACVPVALDSSDQTSFQERGLPAVQLFGGPPLEYHTPADTSERIDPASLVQVASLTLEALQALADRPQPLPAGRMPAAAGAAAGPRRSGIGTVPDFTFAGPGYRLAGVVPDSPAAAAGLAAGDVILAADGSGIAGIKDLAALLRAARPGQSVQLTVERAGSRRQVPVVLADH
ncbi:MAG: M28 family peptidase [Thermodesulfobacteriota bacterium]